MNPPFKMTEDQFCAKAFTRIWNEIPETRRLLIHIPNEAKRSKIEWVQMKAKGLMPGAPDYIFFWKGKCYAIEAKDPSKGRISPDQHKVHDAIKIQNIPVYIVYSEDEFFSLIKSIVYGNV